MAFGDFFRALAQGQDPAHYRTASKKIDASADSEQSLIEKRKAHRELLSNTSEGVLISALAKAVDGIHGENFLSLNDSRLLENLKGDISARNYEIRKDISSVPFRSGEVWSAGVVRELACRLLKNSPEVKAYLELFHLGDDYDKKDPSPTSLPRVSKLSFPHESSILESSILDRFCRFERLFSAAVDCAKFCDTQNKGCPVGVGKSCSRQLSYFDVVGASGSFFKKVFDTYDPDDCAFYIGTMEDTSGSFLRATLPSFSFISDFAEKEKDSFVNHKNDACHYDLYSCRLRQMTREYHSGLSRQIEVELSKLMSKNPSNGFSPQWPKCVRFGAGGADGKRIEGSFFLSNYGFEKISEVISSFSNPENGFSSIRSVPFDGDCVVCSIDDLDSLPSKPEASLLVDGASVYLRIDVEGSVYVDKIPFDDISSFSPASRNLITGEFYEVKSDDSLAKGLVPDAQKNKLSSDYNPAL